MTPPVVRNIKLEPLDHNDPLLAGVEGKHLDAFNPGRAAGHVSERRLRQHGTARLFVADSLLKLWAKCFAPITGDLRLGRPHMLNDDRFKAAMVALDEYTPKQIANAIRAYGQHCSTAPERVKTPQMRLTFEKFLRTALEVWAQVAQKQATVEQQTDRRVEDLREHGEFMAAWSQLPADRQTQLLVTAGSQFTESNPTTSNPKFRAVLQKLMQASPVCSVADSSAASATTPAFETQEAEELYHAFYGMSTTGQQLLVQKAAKQLEKAGYYAGNTAHMGNPKIRARVYLLLRRQLQQSPPAMGRVACGQ